MAYLVLARKYRPKTFLEVVGQQHITKTLKNSILSHRVAHAFIFTGPRGVGKTTTARILAKSLNCQNLDQGEPCNNCEICRDINQGKAVDIIEIDGASNNSVDDIRDLRDKIHYVPTVSRYKIYIIDEVHMLSTAAFNALLKTLEEPPSHAVFILATTEPHKIPATILSRCQRYDFKRLSTREIADALYSLPIVEEKKISQSILTLIAQSADGSMRDAQSVLEQVISCSEGDIKYDDVLYLLGLVKKDRIFSLWQSIFDRNPADILSSVAQILQRGYNIRHFTEQLLQYLRDLMIYKTCPDSYALFDISEEEVEFLKKQSSLISWEELQQYFQMMTKCLDQMKSSPRANIILEMTLIYLADLKSLSSSGDILQRLSALEKKVSDSVSPSIDPVSSSSVSVSPSVNMVSPTDGSASPSVDPASSSSDLVSSSIEQKWRMVLEGIGKEKKTLMPILQKATLDSVTETKLSLVFPTNQPFYLDSVKQENNQIILRKWIQKIFGSTYQIECCTKSGLTGSASLSHNPDNPNNLTSHNSDSGSSDNSSVHRNKEESLVSSDIDDIIEQHQIIKTVMETFSARLSQCNVSFSRKE